MKMPTAVDRRSFPWKPGDSTTVPSGEGSLVSEERLPSVAHVNNHASGTRPSGSGKQGVWAGKVSSLPTERAPPSAEKRFPILGPTRQDTELYFKHRSARSRPRTLSRGLVTRSADRIVSSSSPYYNPFSVAIDTVASTNSTYGAATATEPKKRTRDITGQKVTRSADLPRKRPGSGRAAQKGHSSSRSDSKERAGGSNSRTEIHIKFLSESGQVRPSDMTHRPPQNNHHKDQTGLKTLLPSKHGFHRRSKSPTFKRLIAAAEKLQAVTLVDGQSGKSEGDGSSGHVSSPSGLRLPNVHAVAGDEEIENEEEENGEAEMDNDCKGGFLSSPRGRFRPHKGPSNDSELRSSPVDNNSRVIPPGCTGGHPRTQKKPPLTDRASKRKAAHINDSSPNSVAERNISVPLNGWSDMTAWGNDALSTDSDIVKVSLNLQTSDNPTELHLFLPKLADTVSEADSASVATMSERGRTVTRLADMNFVNQAQTSVARSKTMFNMGTHGKGRPPHHPNHHHNHHHSNYSHHTNQGQAQGGGGGGGGQGGERNSRSQNRRFGGSPVRVPRRDRTPKRLAMAGYEPFIKGEHLKEKLDDFPTLISLEQD